MFGIIYFQLNLDQAGVQDINGVLFLLTTNTSFANMFPVLNAFVPMITLILRENKSGMYRIINLVISKFLVDVADFFCHSISAIFSFKFCFKKCLTQLPKLVLTPILFTAIVYWMADLNNDFEKFASCCLVMILGTLTAAQMGKFSLEIFHFYSSISRNS